MMSKLDILFQDLNNAKLCNVRCRMHTDDDNTAVFRIRKTFDEIMSSQQVSTRSSIKLNFDASLSDSSELSSKQAESFLGNKITRV
jgi:hypothetical protein